MNTIDQFSTEVKNQLAWYVYRLIDPTNGETFYVGKGKDDRVFDHAKLALKEQIEEDLKLERIARIHSVGMQPIHVVHRHGIADEKVALEIEAALIDAYPGITNLVSGHASGARGCMSAQQVEELYRKEEAVFRKEHKILIILINRSATEGRSMIDATSGNWKLNKSRAERADYVAAVVDGVIRQIFVRTGPTIRVGDRWRLQLCKAGDDVQRLYANKRIPSSFRKPGAANPVKYSYK